MLASTNDSPKRLAPLNSPDLKREVMPTTFFFLNQNMMRRKERVEPSMDLNYLVPLHDIEGNQAF